MSAVFWWKIVLNSHFFFIPPSPAHRRTVVAKETKNNLLKIIIFTPAHFLNFDLTATFENLKQPMAASGNLWQLLKLMVFSGNLFQGYLFVLFPPLWWQLKIRLLQLKIKNFHWNNWKFAILGCAELISLESINTQCLLIRKICFLLLHNQKIPLICRFCPKMQFS